MRKGMSPGDGPSAWAPAIKWSGAITLVAIVAGAICARMSPRLGHALFERMAIAFWGVASAGSACATGGKEPARCVSAANRCEQRALGSGPRSTYRRSSFMERHQLCSDRHMVVRHPVPCGRRRLCGTDMDPSAVRNPPALGPSVESRQETLTRICGHGRTSRRLWTAMCRRTRHSIERANR